MKNSIKRLSILFILTSPLQAAAGDLKVKKQGSSAYSLGGHSIATLVRAKLPVSEEEIPSHLFRALEIVRETYSSPTKYPALMQLISKEFLYSPMAMEAFFILNPDRKPFWLGQFMMDAIEEVDLAGMQFFLDHGFDVKSSLYQGNKTALHHLASIQEIDADSMKVLTEHHDAFDEDTIDLEAIQRGRLKAATLLLKHSANPNQFSSPSHDIPVTPWMIAHENGFEELAQLMLDFGADPEIAEKRDEALAQMLEAAVNGDLDALKSTLDLSYQIRVDDSQVHGRTALMLASIHGHLDLVRYLVEVRHASMSLRDQENFLTPYSLATRHAQAEIAEYLESMGGGPPPRFNWVDHTVNQGQRNARDGNLQL